MCCERLHFGLKLTRGSRFITVHKLVGGEGSSLCKWLIFFVRGNGLPDLSLQEEFGETSKHETKKSPKLYNLKLCGSVKVTLVPLCSSN